MKTFSSLSAVMGLWLAVSFSLWLGYRTFRKRDNSRQRKLVDDAIRLIDEGHAIFGAIRKAPAKGLPFAMPFQEAAKRPDEELREDVRQLLNSIEANSSYFDRVNTTKKRLQQIFKLPDFPPLSEILQVRRDFWAASEVLLMDDIQNLGVELADKSTYDAFRLEAMALLFSGVDHVDPGLTPEGARADAVALRLSLAREETAIFMSEVERSIAVERDSNKLPRIREVIAVPWQVLVAIFGFVRETRYLIGDLATTARSLAQAMTSRGLAGAAEELRRARSDLPSQFATAFERAGGSARQGGQDLKRHYEFLLEARELRARYAELLAKTPDLTDKGKQFIARLDLERRGEQFRETSEGAFAWMRRKLVVCIAHLIRALQKVQAKVTPEENKQLVMQPAQPATSQPTSEQPPSRKTVRPEEAIRAPLRALLPPAAPKTRLEETESPKQAFSRLRDLVTGGATIDVRAEASPKPKKEKKAPPPKPRYSYDDGMKKMSFKDLLADAERDAAEVEVMAKPEVSEPKSPKSASASGGSGSLLDRLSSLEPAKDKIPADGKDAPPAPKPKKSRFKLF